MRGYTRTNRGTFSTGPPSTVREETPMQQTIEKTIKNLVLANRATDSKKILRLSGYTDFVKWD
jgi:hypothetical protein